MCCLPSEMLLWALKGLAAACWDSNAELRPLTGSAQSRHVMLAAWHSNRDAGLTSLRKFLFQLQITEEGGRGEGDLHPCGVEHTKASGYSLLMSPLRQ